jgi:hypothetical protein
MMVTLKNWLTDNELHLDSSVCEEVIETEGHCYRDAQGTEYWVCPLLVVQTDTTGTRPLDEEAEANFREWLDVDNNRPHDLTKPNEVVK